MVDKGYSFVDYGDGTTTTTTSDTTDYYNIYENYKVPNFAWFFTTTNSRIQSFSPESDIPYESQTAYIYTQDKTSTSTTPVYIRSKTKKNIIHVTQEITIYLSTINDLSPNGIKLYPLTQTQDPKSLLTIFVQSDYTLYTATKISTIVYQYVKIPAGYYIDKGIEISYKGNNKLAYQWEKESLNNEFFMVGVSNTADTKSANEITSSIAPKNYLQSTLPSWVSDYFINHTYNEFKAVDWPRFLRQGKNLRTIVSNIENPIKTDLYRYNNNNNRHKFGTEQQIPLYVGIVNENTCLGDVFSIASVISPHLRDQSQIVLYKISSDPAISNATISGMQQQEYAKLNLTSSEYSAGWNTGYYLQSTELGSYTYYFSNFLCWSTTDTINATATLTYPTITYPFTIYEITKSYDEIKTHKISDVISNYSQNVTTNKLYNSIITTNSYTLVINCNAHPSYITYQRSGYYEWYYTVGSSNEKAASYSKVYSNNTIDDHGWIASPVYNTGDDEPIITTDQIQGKIKATLSIKNKPTLTIASSETSSTTVTQITKPTINCTLGSNNASQLTFTTYLGLSEKLGCKTLMWWNKSYNWRMTKYGKTFNLTPSLTFIDQSNLEQYYVVIWY